MLDRGEARPTLGEDSYQGQAASGLGISGISRNSWAPQESTEQSLVPRPHPCPWAALWLSPPHCEVGMRQIYPLWGLEPFNVVPTLREKSKSSASEASEASSRRSLPLRWRCPRRALQGQGTTRKGPRICRHITEG